jgi:hypothetical protein
MKQLLGQSPSGLFATQTLTGHVIRGAAAFALLYLAIGQQHFQPCRLVVGGFAGVGGYARLPGLLDNRAGRNHSTALWSDSKLKRAAQPVIAADCLWQPLNSNVNWSGTGRVQTTGGLVEDTIPEDASVIVDTPTSGFRSSPVDNRRQPYPGLNTPNPG